MEYKIAIYDNFNYNELMNQYVNGSSGYNPAASMMESYGNT